MRGYWDKVMEFFKICFMDNRTKFANDKERAQRIMDAYNSLLPKELSYGELIDLAYFIVANGYVLFLKTPEMKALLGGIEK